MPNDVMPGVSPVNKLNARGVAGRLRAALASGLGLFALAGCTVGPDFKRPAAPEGDAYTPPAALSAEGLPEANSQPDATAIGAATPRIVFGGEPQVSWWSLFESPELDDAVRQAVAGNPGLDAARATLVQAGELASANSGIKYPQVDLGAGMGRQKYGAQFLGSLQLPPFTAYGVGPSVRYVLDYNGGEKRSDEQMAALVQYQRGQLDAAYLALTGGVVLQVITVAAANAQIQEVQQLLDQDADNLRLVRDAFAAGGVSRVDVVAAQSQLAADETQLPPLRQQLSEARHQLAILAGRTPGQANSLDIFKTVAPDFDLSRLSLPTRLPVAVPSELVHRRPDILSAEAQLHAATAAVGVATASLYPRIQLTASLTQQATTLGGLFDGAGTAWSLLSALSAPLFDGGTRHAQQRAALEAMQARAADYRQTVLAAFGQVADFMDALDHDAQLIAAQTRAVAATADNVELARASYAAGNSGVLQLLDAQRQHQQAQLGLLRARARQYQDCAQLLLATGGGVPME